MRHVKRLAEAVPLIEDVAMGANAGVRDPILSLRRCKACGQLTPAFPARWRQFDVGLVRREGDAHRSAGALFAALGGVLPSLRRQHALKGFFFMRKPPDVRLRFELTAAAGLSAIGDVLDHLKARRVIRGWVPTHYEPEAGLFGGPEAMAAVHRHFTVDSLLWMRNQQARAPLPAVLLSWLVLEDLFRRATDDRAEAWDVWRKLALLHDRAALAAPQSLPSAATDPQLLQQYQRANGVLAGRLRRLVQLGRLGEGLRSVLAFVALFHWNRHGLDAATRSRLYRHMLHTLRPHPPT
jgi:thiopeptide-type bacteriocin biosynthesis protein